MSESATAEDERLIMVSIRTRLSEILRNGSEARRLYAVLHYFHTYEYAVWQYYY